MQSSTSSSFTASASWGQGQQAPHHEPFQRSGQAYQSGYLMSAVQGSPAASSGQRFDNPALLPMKSKSHQLSHSMSDDYGSDSLFDRPRVRHAAVDDDAPPVNSVTDIIGQIQPDPFSNKSESLPRRSTLSRSMRQVQPPQQDIQVRAPETSFVLVFGYPHDQFASVASTFVTANSTQPERCTQDKGNWFRIGYRNTWDAQRALRRNGEVVDGVFMIGVMHVDGESDVTAPTPQSPDLAPRSHPLSFGKPLAVAPASSAFRPPNTVPDDSVKPSSSSGVFTRPGDDGNGGNSWANKISDVIFGW